MSERHYRARGESWRDRVPKEHTKGEAHLREIVRRLGFSLKSQAPLMSDFCVEGIPIEVFGPMDTQTSREHDIWKLSEILKEGSWDRALWFYENEILKQPNLITCIISLFVRLGRYPHTDLDSLATNIILEVGGPPNLT